MWKNYCLRVVSLSLQYGAVAISSVVLETHSLVPRPFEERKGLVHTACTCAGRPQKKLGELDIIVYLSAYHPYNCTPWTGHYGNATVAMEKPAHARAMCTRPFLSSKGLGMRLRNLLNPVSHHLATLSFFFYIEACQLWLLPIQKTHLP